ncbi:NADP-dependent oxidoreductase [Campylobacter sp. 19-13652]|uniref:NADP-dependent oxidoreductase n=1 Tax=Campylobacter sp. 19-13652 TaxID=2840180 RepID=UPI001C779C13|nr:NADP-dependent oxidoreductase [Campylobacter sp. 19-13652]BCX78686.1 oxidoreductase [Campylobacter sp. 19-13652]
MKAAVLQKYGKKLEILELAQPQVGSGEVLVRLLYAGVNPLDNMISQGKLRLVLPYHTPLIAGNELVGIVWQVGEGVSGLKAGDRVFGRVDFDQIGTFCEFAALRADTLALVPDGFSDEQAACLPLAALTAMQAFSELGVVAGGRLFISGASGGFGLVAVALAKAMGLWVCASGNERAKQTLLSLGADCFIDYKKQDYLGIEKVDYVIDTIAQAKRQLALLKPGGALVSLKDMPNLAFARKMGFGFAKRALFALTGCGLDMAAKRRGVRYGFVFVRADGDELLKAARILEKFKFKPKIDEIFSLNEANLALQKVANGATNGKVLIKIS